MSPSNPTGAILVLNAGSSSLKFSIFLAAASGGLELRARGQMDQFGSAPRLVVRSARGEPLADERFAAEDVGDTGHGVQAACNWLASHLAEERVIAVGHRVVHGGGEFCHPIRLDGTTLARLDALIPLAPLHQPYNLAAIRAAAAWRPGLPQVACFDTAFHRTHSPLVDRFALPAAFYELGIRRYGFHGISYAYIASVLPHVAPSIAGGRVIVAHLGNGASLCALDAGRSVDSTMGFSTLDGLCMGTRAGALDPGVLLHLLSHRGMPLGDVERLLYRESGLRGLSGISSDMRQLLASDLPEARLAVDYFVWRITKEIGGLAAVLGGLDGLVFTAGIGENQPGLRARIVQACAWLGCELDPDTNAAHGPRITTRESKVSAWVIPTHEEEMIAREVQRVLAAKDRA